MVWINQGTIWHRVCEHFAATHNKWISIAALAKALAVKQLLLCQTFYIVHKDDLESKPDPARPGRRLWRVADKSENP